MYIYICMYRYTHTIYIYVYIIYFHLSCSTCITYPILPISGDVNHPKLEVYWVAVRARSKRQQHQQRWFPLDRYAKIGIVFAVISNCRCGCILNASACGGIMIYTLHHFPCKTCFFLGTPRYSPIFLGKPTSIARWILILKGGIPQ